MRKICLAVILCCASQVAFAKSTPPPPQPTVEPDWSVVRRDSETAIKGSLVDPTSAQIKWQKAFRWTYYKAPLQSRVYGWVGCAFVNAKNRMGGYNGDTPTVVVYDNGVKLIAMNEYDAPYCLAPSLPAPQAAFLDHPTQSGGVSIADELSKLAALRDKGVLSEAEFAAQKAKLLGEPAPKL